MSSFRLVTTATAANPNVHDLYLDESGQLEWIGGDITDEQSYARMVAQRIKCRSLQLRGEWYLDQRTGTPWFQRIMRKGAGAETLRQVLREVIEGTPGVRQLVRLDIDFDAATREATVEFEAIAEMNQIVSSAQLDEPLIIGFPELPLAA
jgi:hypothetical protein